jgi:hypothetical protein
MSLDIWMLAFLGLLLAGSFLYVVGLKKLP